MYCGKKLDLMEQGATGTYYVVLADAEDANGSADIIRELSFVGDAYDVAEESADVVFSAFEPGSELMAFLEENPWCVHAYTYVEKTVLEDGRDVTPAEDDGYFYINDFDVCEGA